MKLLRTGLITMGPGKQHFHLLVIDAAAGAGVTSEDQGHRHEIRNINGPLTPQPQIGPDGQPALGPDGAPVMVAPPLPEFSLEDWMLVPAEDGHVHEIQEIVASEEVGEDEAEVSAECVKMFLSCIDRETVSRGMEDESESFYMGDQWEPGIKKALLDSDRAAVTVNLCEGVVDDLVGYMRQNRRDFMCLPTEGTDQKTADLWTLILKIISSNVNLDAEEDMGFEDLVVMGREVYKLYKDETGIDPELAVNRVIPRDTYFGYHERVDMRDCHVKVFARWMDGHEVEELWPEKTDAVGVVRQLVNEPIVIDDGSGAYSSNVNLFNRARKEVRVYEIWRKEFGKRPLIRLPDGTVIDGTAWKTSEARKVGTIPGVEITWKPLARNRKTIMAGTILLEDVYPDLPVGVDGEIFSTYAKFRRNRWWGKLEAGKDLQREVNKKHSQGNDVTNKMSPYGYFWDKRTFPTDAAKEKFKADVSKPGFMCEVSDVNRPPKMAEGTKVPTELINAMSHATEKFYQVLSHDRAWLNAPPDTSGDALAERRRAGMASNEFLFDNHAKLKKQLGKAMIAWVQKIYTPDRVARMVIGRATEDEQINGQAATDFTMQDIVEILKNDATKLDITVSDSPWSATARRANFSKWSDLRKGGVPVPNDVLIDMADMPLADRKRIKASFAAQQQATQDAENQKLKMELGKTAIAKGAPVDAVANLGKGGAGQ
jgi:hypothetical protein